MDDISKMVEIGHRRFHLTGLSADDPYFKTINDGIEGDFGRVCQVLLRKDDVALDVGANIGVTSAILSEILNGGHVHAVEAAPTVFRTLQTNIVKNDLGNVTAHNVAVSDRSGRIRFVEDSAYGHVAAGPEGQEVAAVTIDNLVESLGLERLDFIKIDIEGSEWAALRGAASTIGKFQPIIYMEFNSWCLTAFGRVNTVEFAEWLSDTFAFIYVDPHKCPKRLFGTDMLRMVHDNMVFKHCVENIILCNDGERVGALLSVMADQSLETKNTPELAGISHASKQKLDVTQTELASRQHEHETVRASSWGLTAPLRTVLRRLKPAR